MTASRHGLAQDLTVVKIGDLLARRGVVVPERTLHRFCAEQLGHRKQKTTVRVADGEPGGEVQSTSAGSDIWSMRPGGEGWSGR